MPILGENLFVYVPFTDKIKTVDDLRSRIDQKTIEEIRKINPKVQSKELESALQFVYHHE